MMVHKCNPIYVGGIGRITEVKDYPWAKTQDPIQKISQAKKGWRCGSSGGVPSLLPPKKKKPKNMN
jgi:hypothetical protein